MELEKLGFLLSVWVRVWFGGTPALPRPQRAPNGVNSIGG